MKRMCAVVFALVVAGCGVPPSERTSFRNSEPLSVTSAPVYTPPPTRERTPERDPLQNRKMEKTYRDYYAGDYSLYFTRIKFCDHYDERNLSFSDDKYGKSLPMPHLFVGIVVRNVGKHPLRLPRLGLIDEDGRTYGLADVGYLADDSFHSFRRLNPHEEFNGTAVFAISSYPGKQIDLLVENERIPLLRPEPKP